MEKNKHRIKLRANRASIDDKYAGREPIFNVGDVPDDPAKRGSAWATAAFYYNYHFSHKDYLPYVWSFAEDAYGYDKKKISVLRKLKDWHFIPVSKVAVLYTRGWIYTTEELQKFGKELDKLYEKALLIKEEKVEESTEKKPTISPAERTRLKVMDIVYSAWDEEIIDQWMQGNFKATIDIYEIFKVNGLKSNAINIVKDFIQMEYDVVKDALTGDCEQAVEAYEGYKKTHLKAMVKTMDGVFADLESIRNSTKATKTVRKKKVKTADTQVKALKYQKDNKDYKLTSINPVAIPGNLRLYTFNTKTRKLTEFICTSTDGFIVQGTSIKNHDPSLSRVTTLRKPGDILPDIMKKTPNQIDKIWKGFTTKVSVPNGRLNQDTILLRVLDK